MKPKTNLILILTMLLLTLACATTARKPHLETIVPESEEPSWFALSPNRHKMLYYTGGHYVLNLDTKEKTSLFEVYKAHWKIVSWVDDRYLYSRADGTHWQSWPRLVVDTETWKVRPIAEFSPQEQARIEAGWERWRHNIGGFQDNTPYYSPDGRYYFQSVSPKMHTQIVTIYTADGRELISHKGYVTQAVWAPDSRGIYLQLKKTAFPFFLSGAPGSIVKLLVPKE